METLPNFGDKDSNRVVVGTLPTSGYGLGDSLIYSTLPERYSKLGYDVYLSSGTKCWNKDIFDMVWGLNPYIKGIVDEPPTTVDTLDGRAPGYPWGYFNGVQTKEFINFGNWVNEFPKVYYQPKKLKEFEGVTVVSFWSVTIKLDSVRDKVLEKTMDLIKSGPSLSLEYMVNADLATQGNQHGGLQVDGVERHMVKDLWHLADILWSCKRFIGLETGSSILSCALRQGDESFDCYVFCRQRFCIERTFLFSNQTPIVVL